MASKNSLVASAMSFAHLAGLAPRAAKADEADPKDKNAKGRRAAAEDDDDDKDDRRAEEPDTVDEGDTDEGVDGDEKPDLDDVEDPDDSLDEDAAPEEDDVDPKVKKAAKSGRKAERSRWSKVMGHSSAAGRVATACQMLSTTSMSSRQIVGVLKTTPAEGATSAQAPSLRERMSAQAPRRLAADARQPASDDFGARAKAAMAKVRGS